MPASKKKVIKSLDALDDELKDLLRQQYPTGYESSVTRIINARKEPIFVFPLETNEATYLIKLPSTKNSDGGYDIDFGKKGEEFGEVDDADAFNNEAEESESTDEGDFEGGDDVDGGGGRKDPSYEPDFDN